MVELPQEFRLFGAFDRVIAHDVADRADRQPVARREEERNALAVVDDMIERRRLRSRFQPEEIVSSGIERRGVDDGLRQRRDLLQIDGRRVGSDETARNDDFRRTAAAQRERGDRKKRNGESVHEFGLE